MELSDLSLKLYVVRNQEGKFFRAKGFGGYGKTWVDSLDKAKIYTKLSTARSRVGYFAKNYPTYGVPDIVVLTVKTTEVLDETKRVQKSIEQRKRRELRATERSARYKMEAAQRKLQEAQAEIKRLNNH